MFDDLSIVIDWFQNQHNGNIITQFVNALPARSRRTCTEESCFWMKKYYTL